ncbi:MAG TPA: RluA family pseudouridine synthase [Polyangia bacterium]|nr:RluA family pseudouridine synthase [Polyangia bacterium]
MKQALTVLAREAGATLAAFLFTRLGADATSAIEGGSVHVGGRRVRDPARRLAAGERVLLYDPPARAPLQLRIVHEDADLIVVDKPAGLPVAATRQSAAYALDALLRAAGRDYVGVLHRLDLAASGLVVLSRRRAANAALHAALSTHAAERRYVALVAGRLRAQAGRWTGPVGEKPAATGFRVGERLPQATLVDLALETGRTHQIRVHAAAAGHPVVGDLRHGGPPAARLMLHAHTLALASGRFLAPPPPDFEAVLTAWRRRAG